MRVGQHGKSKNGGIHRNANGAQISLKQNILLTKLQRPPVAPDILPRARLLDRLNEGRQRLLTLISAPAGYGKSTLASSWVAECDSPSGWVSLDDSDRDLRTFLNYFLAAIQPLSPETTFRTEALLAATQLPAAADAARYLLNDLHKITAPFILVLDDYQNIGETPVNDLVAALLAYPVPAMHLALVTRRDPALPISRLRGRGLVTEIRAADLRFTPAETVAFLNKMISAPVDDATAALLEEKTEGWATGLRLVGLYLRDQDDLIHRVQELSGSSRRIAEYLAGEVLSRQNPEIAAYLLETSILDRFCAPLCQAVHSSGVGGRNEEHDFDTQRFIEWLVEANLFVIPLDDQGYWFRYHHLFQSFLQSLLRKQKSDDTVAGLHMRASKWLAENDLIDDAIRHALAAGNTKAAVRLVLQHRYELMNTAQFNRLNRWLALLPEDAVAKTPLLISTRAFIGLERGQDSDVYTGTEQADRILAGTSPESGEYAILKSEVDVLKGIIDMAVGRADSGLAHSQAALGSLSHLSNASLMRSLGLLALAVCLQMKGNPGQAAKVINEALLDPAWPANIRARLHYYLSITYYMDANLDGAISASRECLRIVQELSFTHTKTFACYLLGAAHYWRNEITEAESHLLSVLDDCHLSNPSYVANAGFVLACIYLARNLTGQAEQVLKRIVLHFQELRHPMAQAMAQAFQVDFTLRQGHIKKALQLGKNVDFDMRPPIWFYYVPQLTPIKLLLAEGTDQSLNEAHARLVEMDKEMRRINRKSVRIDVLALLALVCHKKGKEATALAHLKTDLALAEPGGWIRNFVDLGAPMAELLERLNQADPGHKYAQLVLEACKAEARSDFSAGSNGKKLSRLSGQAPGLILTQREIELLPLLAEGLSNKQIAERLFIATVTVKTHLQNVYRKLNAKGRIEALNKAQELGLITSD